MTLHHVTVSLHHISLPLHHIAFLLHHDEVYYPKTPFFKFRTEQKGRLAGRGRSLRLALTSGAWWTMVDDGGQPTLASRCQQPVETVANSQQLRFSDHFDSVQTEQPAEGESLLPRKSEVSEDCPLIR